MLRTADAMLLQPSFRRIGVFGDSPLDDSDCVLVEFGCGDMPRVLNIVGFFNSIELRLSIVVSELCRADGAGERVRQWLGHRFIQSPAAPLRLVYEI